MVINRHQPRFIIRRRPLRSSINQEKTVGGNNAKTGWRNFKEVDKDIQTEQICSQRALSEDSLLVALLSETSIHGVKYIVQGNRHWSERLFWLVAFLLGVASTAYLIHGMWDRYHQTPVIVTFDANEMDTNSIPFPAVTICNNNLISKRRINELKRTLSDTLNSSDPKHIEAEQALGFARYLCGEKTERSHYNGKKMDDVIAFFLNNTDPCDEMMQCKFNSETTPCVSKFKPILTSIGKCCTFNMLPLGLLLKRPNKATNAKSKSPIGDAIIEEQYFTKPLEIDNWSKWEPLKQISAGQRYALSVLVDSKLNDYYCPLDDFEGMRLHIHSCYASPNMWEYSSMVHLGKQTHVRVNADITKADYDIRDYPQAQKKRSCYFGNEKQLKFHRPYSRQNCLAECNGDYIASKCGCLLYASPNHHPEHQEKNVCSMEDYPCILREERNFNNKRNYFCPDCEPLCEEIKYNYQLSTANLLSSPQTWPGWTNSWRKSESAMIKPRLRETVAVVNIFFDSERTVPKLRKALYGWADLIANTGGILGLCLGFSVLSGIELVYFITLRAFCNGRGEGSVREERRSTVSPLKHLMRSRTTINNPPPDLQLPEEGMISVAGM